MCLQTFFLNIFKAGMLSTSTLATRILLDSKSFLSVSSFATIRVLLYSCGVLFAIIQRNIIFFNILKVNLFVRIRASILFLKSLSCLGSIFIVQIFKSRKLIFYLLILPSTGSVLYLTAMWWNQCKLLLWFSFVWCLTFCSKSRLSPTI